VRLRRKPSAALASIAVLAILATGTGCGDKESRGTATRATARGEAQPIEAELSVAELLEALGQGHERTRTLGSHRLSYEASFRLGPPGNEPIPRPVVGHGIMEDQSVLDSLTLEWVPNEGNELRFRLEQHNDKEAGREIIVLGDTVYTHMAHRGWFERELDGDIHTLWLDDAQHAVRDAVEMAAPQLLLSEGSPVEHQGRSALVFELALAQARDPELVGDAPERAWRRDATLTRIEGSVTVDLATGIWLEAKILVGFTMKDGEGRLLEGRSELDAHLELGEVEVGAPETVEPLPERQRLEVERRELLDGH
jgi:hypothetical protein